MGFRLTSHEAIRSRQTQVGQNADPPTLFRGPFRKAFGFLQPPTWIPEIGIKLGSKVNTVQMEGDKRFIRADAKGTRGQIGYETRWALREFPLLQWQWQAVLFPTGSDEREKSRNDSILGLYVIFGHWPFIKAIKYIWSDTLPVGSSFPSPYSSTTRIVVIRSGRSQQGTWVSEKRDVLADYLLIYGEGVRNPVASGIGILTDADETNSHSIGDYAGFQTLAPGPVRTAHP
jgi:hypothetical protein